MNVMTEKPRSPVLFGFLLLGFVTVLMAAPFAIRSLAIKRVQRSLVKAGIVTVSDKSQKISEPAFVILRSSPTTGHVVSARKMKYGALFIKLAFMALVVFVVIKPFAIHSARDFFAAASLCLFYFLLVEFLELLFTGVL